MPTSATHTYTGAKLEAFIDPQSAQCLSFKIPASTTIAKGTVVGERSDAYGTVGVYADAGSNGLDTAIGVMQYDVISDASGNITFGTATGGGEQGETHLSCPVYVSGKFRTTELTGLTAAAVADLGRLVQGSIADGILDITR